MAGEFGLRFYVGIPLTTSDGFNLGTLCVIDREQREVTDRELSTLQDLAAVVMDELELRRAARVKIHEQRALRQEAEQLASTLQANLLPPRDPDVPGMEIASQYLPGTRALQVGGDFFDVFRVESGGWALFACDACGKGPKAASLAGLARWSLRAAAVHQLQPSAVLADLNAVLRADTEGDADDRFCSVVFAHLEINDAAARVTIASAGHPLPWVLRADGSIEQRGTPGSLVGLFDEVAVADDALELGPGNALVFYTDGITETRSADGTLFGEFRLRRVLQDCRGASADEIAARLVDATRRFGDVRRDDAAVLVVRSPARPGDSAGARKSPPS